MSTIALLIDNDKEKTVLEHYFQGLDFKILLLKPNYATCRAVIETNPVCIICEMPANFLDTLYIVRLLNNQKKGGGVPIIAYGNHSSPDTIRSFYDSGVGLYYQRPLQTKLLMEDINGILNGISIKIKRYRQAAEAMRQKPAVQQPDEATRILQEKPVAPQNTAPKVPINNRLTLPSDELDAVERIMDPATTPEERIEIIISRVSEMLAFPFTIVKILEITQSDQSGAADLAKAISADPVIVSSLLNISNTVYYSRQTKRIESVQEAIVRLGFVETKNVALSLSVLNMFTADAKAAGFNRFEFWYHSLACGIFAEMFAKKVRYPHPEKAFICGLLHDFGIILLDEFFNAFFSSINDQVTGNKNEFIAEEKRLWGMSHNSAVAQLFKDWSMPPEIASTISQLDYFKPKYSIEPPGDASMLVSIVGMSNLLAKSLRLGRDCDDIIHPVSRKLLAALKCPDGIDDEFIEMGISRLSIYSDFFNLEKRNFSYPPASKPDQRSVSIIEHTNDMFFLHKYVLITAGYQVDEPSTFEALTLHEKRPEAVLNLINSSIPEQYLEPFTNVPSSRAGDGGNQEQSIPAIFISMDKQPALDFKALSNTYCMPAAVHAGLLETIISNLINRQAIGDYEELTKRSEARVNNGKVLAVNYLNDQSAILALRGVIRLSSFNEIRYNLLRLLDKNYQNIAVQVNDIIDIDNLMTNLLVNFQKKSVQKGINLCFCCIGKEIPHTLQNNDSLKAVQRFSDETGLIEFFRKPRRDLVAA
jgi:HD-like signal output (HDOD) protein/anti-anti-sigma regulatory factor/DNA-binding response OmpR family regulator